MKILNLGSLNIDKIYQVEHFVEPKETIKAAAYEELCGGKGLNQSIALAKAGAEVYHAGCIGQDGGMLVNILEEYGVKTDYLRHSTKPSGHAVIQVNGEGQNNIIICGGSNDDVTEAQQQHPRGPGTVWYWWIKVEFIANLSLLQTRL